MRVCIILPPAPGLFDQHTNVPLGPLYIAAVLEKAGVDVELISLLGHDIPAFWPRADLYAMGFTTPQAGAARGIMELIRSQYPDAKVLAAGAHVECLVPETLAMGFDAVLVGEAELVIHNVIHDLPDLSKIYYGTPHHNLDLIPFPARHLLPQEDLYNNAGSVFYGSQHDSHVASIMGSRGCPFACAFCGNSPLSQRLRYRSAGNILAEMQSLVNMGITCFKFQDDSFTIRPEQVIALGEMASWTFELGEIVVRMHTRVGMFSTEIVHALKQLGVDLVAFGIESGSQKVLDLSDKRISIGQAEEDLRMAHDAGFRTLGLFVFGLPGECEETVDETIAFWERNKPYMDAAAATVFVPYAGCKIAEHPEQYRMHILDHDWNKYWIVRKDTVIALPYDVSFQQMMDLRRKAFGALAELGYAKPEWEDDGLGELSTDS